MAIDWALGRIDPNQATNTLAAFQAGRQQRQQQLRENALRIYAQGGGLSPDLAAVDPATFVQLQQQDRAQADAARIRRREVQTRHMTGTAQVLQALVRAVPDDPANPEATIAARRALAPHLVQSRTDVWDDPAEMEKAIAALASPEANFTTQNLTAQLTALGVDQNAGDFTLGGGRYHAGSATPFAQNTDPLVIPGIGVYERGRPGAPQAAAVAPGLAAPPATGQPGATTGPSPPAGSLQAVFASPADRQAAAVYLQAESGHGPGEDAAILSALVNNAAAHGQTASEFLHANPTFSYGFSRGNGATRNFDPTGPQAQQYGQLIDSLVSGQTPLSPYTNFEGASFPVRNFEHNPTTIGRTRFTTNPLPGRPPAPPIATDVANIDPVDNRRAPPQRIGGGTLIPMTSPAQVETARHNRAMETTAAGNAGRPITPTELQRYRGAVAMHNNLPVYPPAAAMTAAAADTIPGNPALSGAAYLASLPANIRDTVVALRDGRQRIQPGFASSTPANAALMAAARHYDPGLDEGHALERYRMQQLYTQTTPTSPGGLAISGYQLLEHAATLAENFNRMNNASGLAANTNALRNFASNRVLHRPEVGAFQQARDLFASELAKYVRGGTSAELDVTRQIAQMPDDAAPSQMRAKMQTLGQMVLGRVEPQIMAWQNTMGQDVPPPRALAESYRIAQVLANTGVIPPNVMRPSGTLRLPGRAPAATAPATLTARPAQPRTAPQRGSRTGMSREELLRSLGLPGG